MKTPTKPTPGFEPGTARLRIGCSTTELSRRNSEAVSDPKPCPNRAQSTPPMEGAIVSGGASRLTESHTRVLNRRPLLSLKVAFGGISREINDIRRRISAFLDRWRAKSHPETVPEPCLTSASFAAPHTNLFRQNRFTPQAQLDLERAVRDELRDFSFRRHF